VHIVVVLLLLRYTIRFGYPPAPHFVLGGLFTFPKGHAFPTGDTQYSGNQLRCPCALVICRDGVHNDARIHVRINNTNGRNVLNGTFTDGMGVGDGVEEYDEVGYYTTMLDDFRTEHLEFVGQSSRQPLLADVVTLGSDSFSRLAGDRSELWSGADEDDDSVLGGDGTNELSSAPE